MSRRAASSASACNGARYRSWLSGAAKFGEYRIQGRGGSGIINLKVTDKTGPVVQVMEVGPNDQVMVITAYGKIIRTAVKDISLVGRPTQGVRLINLNDDDTVVAVAHIAENDELQGVATGTDVARPAEGDEATEVTPPTRGGNGNGNGKDE